MRSRGTLRPRRTFSRNGITSSGRSGPPKETSRIASPAPVMGALPSNTCRTTRWSGRGNPPGSRAWQSRGPRRDNNARPRPRSRRPRPSWARFLQILVEPRDGAVEGIHLVLALGKAVALAGIIMRVHDLSIPAQGVDHLIGLFLGVAYVVLALQHQQGRLGILKVLDGRGVLVHFAVFHRIA